jgi:carbonic anhydrase
MSFGYLATNIKNRNSRRNTVKIKKIMIAMVSTTALGVMPVFAGEGHAHWGYEGHAGPEHWSQMSDKFATCGTGTRQSPINISKSSAVNATLSKIDFDYKTITPEVINNGHTIQANYTAGSGITVSGKHYDLLQFHFHTPSENTVDGKSYNMEMHLVHKNKEGKLAVVGVFIKNGKHNAEIQKLWDKMPEHAGGKGKASGSLSAADLLPNKHSFAHFKGSLTTPPCSEGVNWYVMEQPIEMSEVQIKKFASVIGHNARPVQSLNDRFVLSKL